MSEHGPAYSRDHSILPEIDEHDADSADVGLYRIKGRSQRGDLYLPISDEWERDVEQILLARVDDGPTELPGGVHLAKIREDGKRLILDWVKA